MKKIIALTSFAVLLSTSATAFAGTVNVTETGSKKVVKVAVSDQVTLTLASSYWDIKATANKNISVGDPVTTPILPGQNSDPKCQVMGSGCASKVWTLAFKKAGKYKVVATRIICGEAMRCDPKDQKLTFNFTVKK